MKQTVSPGVRWNAQRGFTLQAQRGFTFLGVLILVAIIALASAAQVVTGNLLERREKEAELLWIGGEFKRAIVSYSSQTPAGRKPTPSSLAELVHDERFTPPRRHLRKIYIDPITSKAEWGIAKAPDGTMAGVHSLSDAEPIKIGGFDVEDKALEGKTRYSDWVFAPLVAVAGAAGVARSGATAGQAVATPR